MPAPHATYAPDPSYPELARQAKYQAVTVLWLIVDPDGLPQDIRIAKPSGMGLDEAAASSVSKWRFDPALRARAVLPGGNGAEPETAGAIPHQ